MQTVVSEEAVAQLDAAIRAAAAAVAGFAYACDFPGALVDPPPKRSPGPPAGDVQYRRPFVPLVNLNRRKWGRRNRCRDRPP